MFEFEIFTSTNDLKSLKRTWNDCLSNSYANTAFMTYEWTISWWESFGQNIGELYLVIIRKDGQLCGICPFAIQFEDFCGFRIRKLVSLTNYHTPKFDLILSRNPEELIAALLDFLDSRINWHMLQLSYVPMKSRTLLALKSIAGKERIIMRHETLMSSPILKLEGSFEDYYESLSKNFRKNNAYAFRKLSDMGQLEFEEFRNGSGLAQYLEEGFKMEKATWKGEQGTAVMNHPEEWRFYRNVASQVVENGWLRLYFAKIGSKRIAFDYCIAYNNILSLVKIAYDQNFEKYSPGSLLRKWVIQNLFAEHGIDYYDLLGVASNWKLRWAKDVNHLQNIHVFHRDLQGRIMFELKFGIKDKLKHAPLAGKFARFIKEKIFDKKRKWN